jgi:predicted AAA+ superfamily ATPase
MIPRRLHDTIIKLLDAIPAVALLGPRQVGKTTLALAIAATRNSIYLDLENPNDLEKLNDSILYLSGHTDKLVVIDEVQRKPQLFQVLRGLIDQNRRNGKNAGQFLLLGSASIELIKQSSESLAGRIAYQELFPLDALEVVASKYEQLWVRGGFPSSFLSATEAQSFLWRQNFIRTYLERDIPQLGPRIPAETLRRFWTMLAHNHSETINSHRIATSLAIDGKTVVRYLDLLVDLLLVRRLMPYGSNIGKRLIKSPKIYIRDSGLLHTLLNLNNRDVLLGHAITGGSWEGFVIESILSVVPERTIASFYRSAGGAEIDLILELPTDLLYAIEIKLSLSPKIEKGFYIAAEDIKPDKCFVVYPGTERYPIKKDIEAISLQDICLLLSNTK